MPVEIRELIIKGELASPSAQDGSREGHAAKTASLSEAEREDIIEEIVAEVLRRIEQTKER